MALGSSRRASSRRSSCLPIREIKTNRRRTLCNCCTICTISKVTHSAKTNTPAPAHSRKSSICVHDQDPGRVSVSVSDSISFAVAVAFWRQQLQLQLVMFTAYHDSFPIPSPCSHSLSLSPSLSIFFFICFFPCFFPFCKLYFPFVGYFCFKLSQLFKLSSSSSSPSWVWGPASG